MPKIFTLSLVSGVRSLFNGTVVHTCPTTFGDRLSVRSYVAHCALKRSFVIEISFGRVSNRLTQSLVQTSHLRKKRKLNSKVILYLNWVGGNADRWIGRVLAYLESACIQINLCTARSEPKTISIVFFFLLSSSSSLSIHLCGIGTMHSIEMIKMSESGCHSRTKPYHRFHFII